MIITFPHAVKCQYQRLIVFFAAKNGEALYGQQKQDLELTVAQIVSSLLQNPALN